MGCATVTSWPCFCSLYRTSSSLAAKNIINLILVLTIWWCPCVESSLVLLEEGVCYDQCILLAKLFYLCPISFCTPRPNFPVTPVCIPQPQLILFPKKTWKFFFFNIRGQESLRRNGVAITFNNRVGNAVLGCNLKNDRMISVHVQGEPFNLKSPRSMPQPAMLKKLKLNGSTKTYKTF